MANETPAAARPAVTAEPPPAIEASDEEPFRRAELYAALRSPITAIDVLLAQRERWVTTVAGRRYLVLLGMLLVLWGCLFTLPFALVLALGNPLNVAFLFGGSSLICLPSLHVVSAYVGVRVTPGQTFALCAIGPVVAGTFSLGFAPVLWFLDVTIDGEAPDGGADGLATGLLAVAVLAGAVHLLRCLALLSRHAGGGALSGVALPWLGLLLFITYRMARLLGLS